MQGLNSMHFKYIIITEHVGFIPDNIFNTCKIIHVPKPTVTNYNKCLLKNNDYDNLKLKNTAYITPHVSEMLLVEVNKKKQSCSSLLSLFSEYSQPHEKLCNSILESIKNPDNISFLAIREMLYDILVYNYELGECIWYIINNLIKEKYINMMNLSSILIHTYTSFQYYNNNYRPIYHLENYIYNLITNIHNYEIADAE